MTTQSFYEFESTAYPKDPAVPPGTPYDLTEPYIPPDPTERQPPISDEEVKSKRRSFIELILRAVVQAIFGIFLPSKGTAASQFAEWAGGVVEGTMAFLYRLFLVGDLIEVISRKEDGDLNDLGTVINNIITGAQELFDGLVGGFLGWIGSGFKVWEAKQAAVDQGQTLAAFAALLADLKNDQDRRGNSGVAVNVSFVNAADASSLGSDFDQVASGPGPAVIGIQDGMATFLQPAVIPAGRRSGIARYQVAETNTNFQIVGCAFASAPRWYNLFEQGYNYIYARMNDTETDYVYVEFGRLHCELGAVIDGEKFVWERLDDFRFHGGIYWLQTGTSGGQRIYRVLQSNLLPIITHTEVGSSSLMDDDHRYCGFGMATDSIFLAVQAPGRVLSFGFADNTPAVTLGSFARVYRGTTTDTANMPGNGDRAFPSGAYDTLDRKTDDIDWDGEVFTVHRDGSYIFAFRAESDSTLSTTGVVPLAYVNGSVPIGGRGRGHQFSDIDQGNVKVVGDTFILYLEAGDEVKAGVWSSANLLTLDFQGDATGQAMFMTLAFIRSEAPPNPTSTSS